MAPVPAFLTPVSGTFIAENVGQPGRSGIRIDFSCDVLRKLDSCGDTLLSDFNILVLPSQDANTYTHDSLSDLFIQKSELIATPTQYDLAENGVKLLLLVTAKKGESLDVAVNRRGEFVVLRGTLQ